MEPITEVNERIEEALKKLNGDEESLKNLNEDEESDLAYMKKIKKAFDLSKDKQEKIDTYEKTKMADMTFQDTLQFSEKLQKMKDDKKEFDDMTRESLKEVAKYCKEINNDIKILDEKLIGELNFAAEQKKKYNEEKEKTILETGSEEKKRMSEEQEKMEKEINKLKLRKERGEIKEEDYNRKVEILKRVMKPKSKEEKINAIDEKMKKIDENLNQKLETINKYKDRLGEIIKEIKNYSLEFGIEEEIGDIVLPRKPKAPTAPQQKGQAAQQQPAGQQPAPQQNGQAAPQQDEYEEPKIVWSASSVGEIKINAKDKNVHINYNDVENVEDIIGIKESMTEGKKVLKSQIVKKAMKSYGKKSALSRFFAKRKLNPIILNCIKENKAMMSKYIEAALSNKNYPFEYEIDLTDSKLPKKATKKLNKIALQERKIEGNKVIGAKSFWDKFKTKNALSNPNEPKKLNAAEEFRSSSKIDQDKNDKNRQKAIKEANKELTAKINEMEKTYGVQSSKLITEIQKLLKNPEHFLSIKDPTICSEALKYNQSAGQYIGVFQKAYEKKIFKFEEDSKGKNVKQVDQNGNPIVNENMVEELSKYKTSSEIAKNYFQSEENAKIIFENSAVKNERDAKNENVK